MADMLTQSRLKELLHYAPETGDFTRLGGHRCCPTVGLLAGAKDTYGYIQICVDGVSRLAHRLVWLYTHGVWPTHEIDHINGIRDDNRLVNLRESTRAQNCQNVAKYKNNTSGFIGVYWALSLRKWRACIQTNGKKLHLGYFDTPEAAHSAYLAAKAGLHTFQPTVRVDDVVGLNGEEC